MPARVHRDLNRQINSATDALSQMGHAGAIVTGNAGSYAGKRKALEAAGVVVVDTPSQIAAALATRLNAGRADSQLAAAGGQ